VSRSSNPHRPGAVAVLAVTVAALLVAIMSGPASADQPADRGEDLAPGNRGTVKIHRATTPDDDRRDEPKVCPFRIVGFGFPDDADLVITIEGHGGPNAGPDSFDTTLAADQLSPEGDFAIAGPALADGMYKLYVENTTAPGGAKQKVFKIDCSEEGADETGTEVSGETLGGESTGSGLTGRGVAGSGLTASGVTGGDTDVMVAGASTAATPAGVVRPEVLGVTLVRDADAAPSATARAAASSSSLPAALAFTGADLLRLTLVAAACLVLGTAMVLAGRRRTSLR
jgi:hypothetical protein